MGKENTIYTGGSRKYSTIFTSTNNTSRLTSNLNANNGGIIYGVVTAVNTETKEVLYNILDNNSGVITGQALPLHKNNIKLPDIDNVIPLIRGPRNDAGPLGNQYGKTVYYMDPISVLQTLDQNIITRETQISPLSNEINITPVNINNAQIGIPSVSNISSLNSNKFNNNQLNQIGEVPIVASIDAIFVSGKRSSIPAEKQFNLFKEGYNCGLSKNILHYYFDDTTAEAKIKKNLADYPNIPIFLYSAGCRLADEISLLPNVDKKKIFMIEPYAIGGNKHVTTAVANGVPVANVFYGENDGTGLGLFKTGATPSNAKGHFNAPKVVGSKLSWVK